MLITITAKTGDIKTSFRVAAHCQKLQLSLAYFGNKFKVYGQTVGGFNF